MNTVKECTFYKDFSILKDDENMYLQLKYCIKTEEEIYQDKPFVKYKINLKLIKILIVGENYEIFRTQKSDTYNKKINDCNWDISGNSRKSEISNIFVDSDYRSIGIGTLMLNQMLSYAKDIAPDSELGGNVYPDKSENGIRRDNMYTKVGLIIKDSRLSIDKMSNLKINNDIPGIIEEDILACWVDKNKKTNEHLDECKGKIKRQNKLITEYLRKNYEHERHAKRYKTVILSLAIFLLILGVIVFYIW